MLSVNDIKQWLVSCQQHVPQLELHALQLQREHIKKCIARAAKRKQPVQEKRIKDITKQEAGKKTWRIINKATSDPKGGSVTRVQMIVNGITVECTSQDDIEGAIFQENETRFQLADSDSIYNTVLGEQLGYLADTEVAAAFVNGTYEIPPEVDDTTTLLLEEIGQVRMTVTNGAIIPEAFKYNWKHVQESTSSSYLSVHFGHYKATAYSEFLSAFFAWNNLPLLLALVLLWCNEVVVLWWCWRRLL